MSVELKTRINDDVKVAMRARDKERLGVLRLITSAIKQREVDERIELSDTDVLQVLEDLLRRRTGTGDRTLRTVCQKIQKKIGWTDGRVDVRRFLNDFYAAQRAALEKDMLFGQRREHKGHRPDGPQGARRRG